MKLWQMLLARRGLMDVAEAHERGGAGGVAADNEQSTQDPDKQGEQKEQPKGDDEYADMTHEELLAELRKTKKAGAELLKENMKRKEKERTLADQLAQYGDIDPARARQLLEAEQAAENARREAEQAELERRGEFDAVKKQMIEAHQAELAQRDERYTALESENASLKSQLVEMTVGASFSNSLFLRDKVLMTPAKARVIYGSHFEVGEDGSVVGYDKPAGHKERAVLVDGEGNGTGLVTGVAPGKVKITATDQETQLSASVEVTVNPVAVQSVTVTPDSTSVEKGKSVSLKANVQPSNATNKAVTWSSKNEDKATVDQSGNVTGVEVGTATIEIVSQDGSKKATATVEVTAPVVAVTGVEIDPNSTTVEANKTVQLTANVEPVGATNKTVTWESKNTEFATVDSETGVVTGVAAGTATIEVTTQDGSHKATATVEVTAAQE